MAGRKPKYSDEELIDIVKQCFQKSCRIMKYTEVAATAMRLGYQVTYKDLTRPSRAEVRDYIDKYNEELKKDSFRQEREYEILLQCSPDEFMRKNNTNEKMRQGLTFLFGKINNLQEIIADYQKEVEKQEEKLRKIPDNIKEIQEQAVEIKKENRYLRKWIDHNLNLGSAQKILDSRRQNIQVRPKQMTEDKPPVVDRMIHSEKNLFSVQEVTDGVSLADDVPNISLDEFMQFLGDKEI